ncbi:YicC family protein [Chitinibacter bivalviorum]|uniref:YicC family protein n=1 Tax=Chitinibacter bivalviorum TaxID=2739434 RepID=A0A7H9BDQ3_9NEIS|nr:YicC/YloC family endoribonuclease [Chitinibacter bivalviorum]QLG86830.1 YicC family protein [Chitinibacter bivalviorum]
MIYSMTGYASSQRELSLGVLSVELRAVNHRFLDLSLRLPEEFRALEGAIREKLTGRLNRGKLECRLNFNAKDGANTQLRLNNALVAELLRLADQVKEHQATAGDLRMGEILRWPGVIESDALPTEVLQATALEILDVALDDFLASRAREGEKLGAILLARADEMEQILAEIKPRLPQIIEEYEAKLTQRFVDAIGTADDDRIRQEMVMFAQKVDVQEEVDRLATHIAELRRIVKTGGNAGKRLDFLMQELNREANTFGSKSISVDTTKVAMALKVLIEQMREQIQNIE